MVELVCVEEYSCPQALEKGIRSPEDGVKSCCELPAMGAGNRTHYIFFTTEPFLEPPKNTVLVTVDFSHSTGLIPYFLCLLLMVTSRGGNFWQNSGKLLQFRLAASYTLL